MYRGVLACAICLFILFAPFLRAQSAPDWVQVLETADPYDKRHWRRDIPGAYRTAFGTQFHVRCAEMLDPLGVDRSNVGAFFETLVESTVRNVYSSCSSYPELKPWLGEFATKLRRMVVTCSKLQSRSSMIAVGSFAEYLELGDGVFEHLESIQAWGFRPTTVAYSQFVQLFWKELSLGKAEPNVVATYTLAHETFHFTSVNSQRTPIHATLHTQQALKAIKNGECDGDHKDFDRVYMLPELCGGVAREDVRDQIFLHFRNCREKGHQTCETIFKRGYDSGSLRRESLSKGLSPKNAKSLCDRFIAQGERVHQYKSVSTWAHILEEFPMTLRSPNACER